MSDRQTKLAVAGIIIVLVLGIYLAFRSMGQRNQPIPVATPGTTQADEQKAYKEEYDRLAQEYQLDGVAIDQIIDEGTTQYSVGGVTINVNDGTDIGQESTDLYINTEGKTNQQIVVELYQSNPDEFERQFKELAKEHRQDKNEAYQEAIQAQKDKGIYIEPKYLPGGSPNPKYGKD